MHKSIIRKSITRKLSTAQYETLDVHVETEEEIEWEDVKDRMKKTENISKVLIMDFNRTLVKTLDDLKLHKKLSAINGNAGKSVAKSPKLNEGVGIVKKSSADDDDDDFDFLI